MGARKRQAGFTLIEIIFVSTIIVIVYAVAIPQFNLVTGTETAEKLGRLAGDIRSAFDMAVLHNRPYRIVFMMQSGDYWLEQADRSRIFVGDEKLNRDPTEFEEAEAQEVFEQNFQEFVNLAGEEYKDSDSEQTVKPFSPVIQAKESLRPVKWSKVENMEWSRRSIGPYLMFKNIQAEHHGQVQSYEVMGEDTRAMLYFFPNGYVEQCMMHIAFRKSGNEIDTDQPPYTLKVNPYEGTADITSGEEEIEIKDADDVP